MSNASIFARRVLIIAPDLPVPFNQRTWQEATELARQGHIVSVICPKGKNQTASYEYREEVHIFRHPHFEAKNLSGTIMRGISTFVWELMLSGRVFFTTGFDAIAACNPPDTVFLIGGFYKFFFNKKFLFDCHVGTPELYEAKFQRRGLMHRLMLWLERMTFKTADICITGNESLRCIAFERGQVKQDKIFTVRSAPSLDSMRAAPAVPSLKEGRRFLVVFAGHIGAQQGIPHLIEAARIFSQDMKRTDTQFLIIGDGPALAGMRKLAAMQGTSDCLTFAGHLTDDDTLAALSIADVCVEPGEADSTHDASACGRIMDYMALGKPVVQFDTKEGRFTAGDASLYAQSRDAGDLARKIASLLDDPAKREAMGKFGRARVENALAWNFEAPKLLAAYEALFVCG